MGRLEVLVVRLQHLLLGFREPVPEALSVQGVCLAEDAIVVERIVVGAHNALYLEGQPAAVARRVIQELHIVARAAERGNMGHTLREMTVRATLIDRRHRHHRLHRVNLRGPHHVELLIAH